MPVRHRDLPWWVCNVRIVGTDAEMLAQMDALIEGAKAVYQRVQDTRRSEVVKRLLSRRLTCRTYNAILERGALERHRARVEWAKRAALDACGGNACFASQLLVAELLSVDMPIEAWEYKGFEGMRYIAEFRSFGSGRRDAGDFGAWQAAITQAAATCAHRSGNPYPLGWRSSSGSPELRRGGVTIELSPDPRVRRALLWGQVRNQLVEDDLWAESLGDLSVSDNVWEPEDRPTREAAAMYEAAYDELVESIRLVTPDHEALDAEDE